MAQKSLFYMVCFTLFATILGDSCTNPEISVKTFTNEDATILTHIAFISEFSVACSNGVQDLNLYANIGDNIVPVSRTGENKYQVSWVEDVLTTSSGYRQISLYDEEGYAAYRKAVRAGENVDAVATVGQFTLSHSGSYQGPWLKSEFIAAALSFIVAYLAFSSRSKLLA